jgi:mono/diheme cytochrome c family protein
MRRLALLALLPVVAAGCVDGTKTRALPSTVVGTVAEAPQALPGKAIFTSSGCASCHTLKDANTTGTVGPNLDEAKPEKALILNRVTNGKAPMPEFKDQLSEQQIADVVDYVYSVTHQ